MFFLIAHHVHSQTKQVLTTVRHVHTQTKQVLTFARHVHVEPIFPFAIVVVYRSAMMMMVKAHERVLGISGYEDGFHFLSLQIRW